MKAQLHSTPQRLKSEESIPEDEPPLKHKAEWLVLFYLAGDLDNPRGPAIRKDLHEILAAGRTEEVEVAVQFDCHENCYRYIPRRSLPEDSSVCMIYPKPRTPDHPEAWKEGHYSFKDSPSVFFPPHEILGRINSGSGDELENFLIWGISRRPAKRIALVLSGKNKLERDRLANDRSRHPMVFTICRDDSTRNHLGFADFSRSIKQALERTKKDGEVEQGPGQLDILALDSTHSQFLELAHELDRSVKVLVGPQTAIPTDGWNYTAVIRSWQEAAAKRPGIDEKEVAILLVEKIGESYKEGIVSESRRPTTSNETKPKVCAVSALDLSMLESISMKFDTVCLNFMHALGEGQIWDTRTLLHRYLREQEGEDHYDCGKFFGLLALSMSAKASLIAMDWLAWNLRNHGSGDWNRTFWNELRTELANRKSSAAASDPWADTILDILGTKEQKFKSSPGARQEENFRHRGSGSELLGKLRQYTRTALDGWTAEEHDRLIQEFAPVRATGDWLFDVMRRLAVNHLSPERVTSLDHSESIGHVADRLADQAGELLKGLGTGGFIIKREVTPITPEKLKAKHHNTWSGVSLYRPGRLDELMNPEYQKFSFHRKIHWAALLGAIHLIESRSEPCSEDTSPPPDEESLRPSLAMWRLVSSLLTTGSASTRRDLLERLSGSTSVVWGMRNQFRVLVPAPMLTLSIEKQAGLPKSLHDDYIVRLESTRRDAVITEAKSRVSKTTFKGIEKGLNDLLASNKSPDDFHCSDDESKSPRLTRLASFGGILSDEVLQSLGRVLTLEGDSIRESARQQGLENSSVHLQLQLSRELMKHPWEIMSFNGCMLGEQFAIGRQIYTDSSHSRPVAKRQQGKVRILIVVPSYQVPNNLYYTQTEGEDVCSLFERTLFERVGDMIDFKRDRDFLHGDRATWRNFELTIKETAYDIIHFAGHGHFDGRDPESSGWRFSGGDIISAASFRNLMHNHPSPPWLVYANACESAADAVAQTVQPSQNGAPIRTKYHSEVFGLASAFIGQGVAAYIGAIWKIEDMEASRMATDFYTEILLRRSTLGEALLRAKLEQRKAAEKSGSLGWTSLVLYGDPTGELVQALAGGQSIVPKPSNPSSSTFPKKRATGRPSSRTTPATASGESPKPDEVSPAEPVASGKPPRGRSIAT